MIDQLSVVINNYIDSSQKRTISISLINSELVTVMITSSQKTFLAFCGSRAVTPELQFCVCLCVFWKHGKKQHHASYDTNAPIFLGLRVPNLCVHVQLAGAAMKQIF